MKPELIWDLPTRLSHWLLAAGCGTAFALALASPEQSKAFSAHMLCGVLLLPIILFRIVWGVTGSRYARFTSFLFSPKEAFNYLRGTLTGRAERYLGHNPAASYAIFMMLILVIGSVLSGVLIPGSKIFEELHELVSYALLGVIAVHLVGVLVHTVVHRENTAFSMLNGRKVAAAATLGINSSHPIIGLMLLLTMGVSTVAVVRNYDFTANVFKVPLVGIIIPMGKTERPHGSYGDYDD